MRYDKTHSDSWSQQWEWDREHIIQHQEEYADKHDKLCDEVHKNTIDIAIIWTKVALIALIAGGLGGCLGALAVGFLKILPALLKLMQTTSK